jgi:hypothetical protein
MRILREFGHLGVVGTRSLGRVRSGVSLSALGLMLVACGGGSSGGGSGGGGGGVTPDPVEVSLAQNANPSVSKADKAITLKFVKGVTKVDLDKVNFGGKKPLSYELTSDGGVKFLFGEFPEDDDLSLSFDEGAFTFSDNGINSATPSLRIDTKPPAFVSSGHSTGEAGIGESKKDTLRLSLSESLDSVPEVGDVRVTRGDTVLEVESVNLVGSSESGYFLELTLKNALSRGSDYVLKVEITGGLTDLKGNQSGSLTTEFSVNGLDTKAPELASNSLVLGRVDGQLKELIVSFDEALGSLGGVSAVVLKDGQALGVSATLAYGSGNDKTKIVITANDVLVEGVYSVTLTGVVDAKGNAAGSLTAEHVYDVTLPTLGKDSEGEIAALKVDKAGKAFEILFSEELLTELTAGDFEVLKGSSANNVAKVSVTITSVSWVVRDGVEDRKTVRLVLQEAIDEGSFYKLRVKSDKVVDRGSNFAGSVDTWLETETDKVDTVAPTFDSLRFLSSTKVELTFSEDLGSIFGLSSVSLTRQGGGGVPSVTDVSFVNQGLANEDRTKVVLTLNREPEDGTYDVILGREAVKDGNGNEGSASGVWTKSLTYDTVAPSFDDFSFSSATTMVLSFSEELKSLFGTGDVTLAERGGDSTAPSVTGVSFLNQGTSNEDRTKVVLTLGGSLEQGAGYTVSVDAADVKDKYDNAAGSGADKLTRPEKVYDTVAPTFDDFDFSSETTLVLSFSEDLKSLFTTGDVTLAERGGDGTAPRVTGVSFLNQGASNEDRSKVVLTLGESLEQGAHYKVSVNAVDVVDANDNLGGSGDAKLESSEKTYDTVGPSLTTTSAVSAVTKSGTQVLTLTFDETVVLPVAPDKTKFEIFDTSGTKLSVPASVTLGSGGKSIEIALGSLVAGTSYNVRILAGALEDSFGNANTQQQTSTSLDNVRPTLEGHAFVKDPNDASKFVLELTFSEDVALGTVANSIVVTKKGTPDRVLTISGTPSVTGRKVLVRFTEAVSDGTYEVALKAGAVKDTSESANLLEALTESLSLDTTAPPKPVIVLKSGGVSTRDATPTLSLSNLEIGSTVSILIDGTEVHSFKVTQATEDWTVVHSLDERSHSIVVKATDAAGNESASSDVLSLNVDMTAPSLPGVSLKDGKGDGTLTNDVTPTLSLSGLEVGSTVSIFVDGTFVTSFVASKANEEWTAPNALSSGLHKIEVKATDAAGNESSLSSQSVSVDNTAPFMIDGTPFSPNDKKFLLYDMSTGELTLYFSERLSVAPEALTVGNFYLTGAVPTSGYTISVSGTTIKLTDLPRNLSGSFRVNIRSGVVMDEAGNAFGGGTAGPAIFIDTRDPLTPSVALKDGKGDDGTLTDNTTPTLLLGNLEREFSHGQTGVTVRVSIDDVVVHSFHVPNTRAGRIETTSSEWKTGILSEGSHEVEVTVEDTFGNTSSKTLTITIDTTPPLVPVVSLKTGGGVTAAEKAVFTLSNLEVGSTVKLYRKSSGGLVEIDSFVATGTSSDRTLETGLTDGETYEIIAKATDKVGNEIFSAGLIISVDTGATIPPGGLPGIVLKSGGSMTDDSTPTFTVSGVSSGDTVSILVGGNSVGSVVATGTTVEFTLSSALADGEHTVTAQTGSGSGLKTSAGLVITVDTAAPALSDGDNNFAGVQSLTYDKALDKLSVHFGEDVVLDDASKIKLMKLSRSGEKVEVDLRNYIVKAEGDRVTLLGSDLSTEATVYYVVLESGAISDKSGNDITSSLTTSEVSVDLRAPKIVEGRLLSGSMYEIKFSAKLRLVKGADLKDKFKVLTASGVERTVTASVDADGDLVLSSGILQAGGYVKYDFSAASGVLEDYTGNEYVGGKGEFFVYGESQSGVLEYDSALWSTDGKTLDVTFKSLLIAGGSKEARDVMKESGLTDAALAAKIVVTKGTDSTNLVESARVYEGKLVIQLDKSVSYSDGDELKFTIGSSSLTSVWGDSGLGAITTAKTITVDKTNPTFVDGDAGVDGIQNLTRDETDGDVFTLHFSEELDSAVTFDHTALRDVGGSFFAFTAKVQFFKSVSVLSAKIEGNKLKLTTDWSVFEAEAKEAVGSESLEGFAFGIALERSFVDKHLVKDLSGNPLLPYSAPGDGSYSFTYLFPAPSSESEDDGSGGLLGLGGAEGYYDF